MLSLSWKTSARDGSFTIALILYENITNNALRSHNGCDSHKMCVMYKEYFLLYSDALIRGSTRQDPTFTLEVLIKRSNFYI